MASNLDLPAKLEQYLFQSSQNEAIETVTNIILSGQKALEAAMLLQSWIDDEDLEEQQETGQYLIHALDEDRLPEHKLFPPEMKGVTW